MTSFIEKDEIKSQLKYKQLFILLWPYAKRFWPLGIAASALMLMSIVSARLLPQVIAYIIDHGIKEKSAAILVTCAWIYLSLEITRMITQWAYVYLFNRFGNALLVELRQDLIEHVQNLPLDYFHRNPVGRITTRLTNDPANLNDVFSEGMISIISNITIFISLIISMAILSWKLTLFSLVTTPLFIWTFLWISNRMRLQLRESKKKLAELSSLASESLQGIRVLQILQAQKFIENKFVGLSSQYKDITLASISASALMQPALNLFTAVLVASALAGGSYLSLNENLALGSFAAFLMYAMDFSHPLRDILDKYQRFQNSLTSGERVFQIFQENSEHKTNGPNEIASDSKRPDSQPTNSNTDIIKKDFDPHIQHRLEFKQLSFRYHEDQPWVLRNFNLQVNPQDRIALIGRTGAGKSTLISLLQRFYAAAENQILVDGQCLQTIPKDKVRRWVGVVQQDPILFRGTLSENLSLQNSDISKDQMLTALEAIGALDYLKSKNLNLESWIEEKGANLSLGERQLICFARIWIENPALLILDEATASVDSETEVVIQNAIKKMMGSRTCLIVAHRYSTLKDCNRFLNLDNGSIEELDQVPVAGS